MSCAIVPRPDDPAYVVAQYATEDGLAARKAAYRAASGPDAREVALSAVAERRPADVLEVGCGEGELAERIARDLGARTVAVDQSPRMVELTSARGVDACIADVQQLPFPDGAFDVVLAAWMLYHVQDLDRGLNEIVRVLRPGGRLVAVTNGADHLRELFGLAGIERWDLSFDGENGAERLRRYFAAVERRDAPGTVVFENLAAVRAYFASSERLAAFAGRLPAALDAPLVARRRPVVFVAEKAA